MIRSNPQKSSNKFFIYSILSSLYFALAAPYFAEKTINAYNGNPTVFIGILLIIFVFLEYYAFPKKMKLVKQRVGAVKENLETNAMVLWFFHATISAYAIFMISKTFDINIYDEKNNVSLWIIVIIIAVFIKEIALLMPIISDERLTKKEYKKLLSNENLFDIILLMYSWLTYTILWTLISKIGDTDMHKDNIGLYLINLIVAGAMFLFIYLPFRIPEHFEKRSLIKTKKDKNKFYLSIFIVVVGALSRL